jgi:hypothetical protein
VKVVLLALVIFGASFTFTVNVCVPFGVTPLIAVRLNVYCPPAPTLAVPLKVAVPLPLSVKVRPDTVPVWLMVVTVGKPLVVMLKLELTPTWNVAVLALVKARG